ncbi:hypothetical protein [Modestobacter italicus]|uniref:hypothetical protein n=1 Tax=Modestobacter italicus (strain DSM 44449 / CECT 9708 / BC 501) TaxID=2732864 RepID=UPI001C9526F2|nr:hypothetical protein [Modestobacter italicus]
MHTTTVPNDPATRAAVSPPHGRWAAVGVLAGVLGAASIWTSLEVSAAQGTDAYDDAEVLTQRLSDEVPMLLAFHVTTALTAVLLVVVAAGLERRLTRDLARTAADSLLPRVAGLGLLLVSVAALLGSGLNTEFVFLLGQEEQLVPENAAFYAHWVATIPWLWVGAGVSALCVAAVALRHRALPRWLGWASLALGGLTLLLGVSPLQYMAGMTGPIWLLVAMTGLLRDERSTRR